MSVFQRENGLNRREYGGSIRQEKRNLSLPYLSFEFGLKLKSIKQYAYLIQLA